MSRIVEFSATIPGSLLESASRLDLERLARFVDDVNRGEEIDTAILILRGSHTDYSARWLGELRDELLLDEVYERVIVARQLLAKIRTSSKMWIFATDGDCLGGYFELAMCCDSRLFFEPLARVGFPEISGGLFPFLGGFEQVISEKVKTKKQWLEQSVFSVREAAGMGIVEQIFYLDDWQHAAVQWAENLPPAKVKRANSQQDPGIGLGTMIKKAFAAMEREEEKSESKNVKANNWELSWELLDREEREPGERGWIMAYLGARHLLNDEYLLWVEHLYDRKGARFSAERVPKFVMIDLRYLAPPVKPIRRLLDAGVSLVFFSPDASVLKDGLGLMFNRFEKLLGNKKATRVWENQVMWSLEDPRSVDAPLLSWRGDDHMFLSYGSEKLDVLRFLGNRGSAGCGWCEVSLREETIVDEASECYRLASLMSDGVIPTRSLAEGKVPLSTFVRSVFLEELIKQAHTTPGGTGKLLPILKEQGWGFAAEDNSWDHFLRARREAFIAESESVKLLGVGISEESWRISVWREPRQKTRQSGEKKSDLHPMQVSLHLAHLCALLEQVVLASKSVDSAQEASMFVGQALGFPERMGCPRSFFEMRGIFRFKAYCEHNWPQYRVDEFLNA